MNKTRVVNLNHESYDVYIGRAGKGQDGYFGNPYYEGTLKEKIENFKAYAKERIATDGEFRDRVKGLYGKKLGCFCKPLACHGDVLAQLAYQLHREDEIFG